VGWKKVQLMLVLSYKTTFVHSLLPPDFKARTEYCRWFQDSVFNGLADPEPMCYSDKVWFILHDDVNTQNNRCRSTENSCTVHEVPIGHGGLLGPCCFLQNNKF
jgi:hypothetical protein